MFLITLLIGVLGRLLIHIPNVTPLTSLCLLAPAAFSRRDSFLVITLVLLISDLSLHFALHYPVLGLWSVFTYSGWFATLLAGFVLQKNFSTMRAMSFTFSTSLLFWVWTNFGTWCTTAIYPHTSSGLMQCFIAGLPFLRNGIVGSLVWSGILLIALHFKSIRHALAIARASTHSN